MAMTAEQIKAIETEINSFGEKSIQYASSDPELSAHYNRLYRASKMFLTKSAKMALSARHKEINEKRRAARQSTSQSGIQSTPQSGIQRTSQSSQRA